MTISAYRGRTNIYNGIYQSKSSLYWKCHMHKSMPISKQLFCLPSCPSLCTLSNDIEDQYTFLSLPWRRQRLWWILLLNGGLLQSPAASPSCSSLSSNPQAAPHRQPFNASLPKCKFSKSNFDGRASGFSSTTILRQSTSMLMSQLACVWHAKTIFVFMSRNSSGTIRPGLCHRLGIKCLYRWNSHLLNGGFGNEWAISRPCKDCHYKRP